MGSDRLTSKQESFAFHVASGLNFSDAYRASYDCDASKPQTINRNANAVMEVDKVSARVDALRMEFREESGITSKRVTEMLQADRSLAHDVRQAGAAVSATMGMAKVNGLLDKAEATTLNLTIEQSSPRDIAKAILRVMAQAVRPDGDLEPVRVIDAVPAGEPVMDDSI